MHSLILSLLALAFLFWFYSSIVLPEIRESITFKLFALRDELRRHKIEHPDVISDQAFIVLQMNINTTIALTPWISPVTLFQARSALKQNLDLLKTVDRRSKLLQYESGKTVARIYDETQQQLYRAFVANSAQLLVFVIPVWLAWELCYYLSRKMPLRSWLTFWAGNIAAVPKANLEELSPEISSLIPT